MLHDGVTMKTFPWLSLSTLVFAAACTPTATPTPLVVTHNERPTRSVDLVAALPEEGTTLTNSPDPGTAVPVTPDDPAWGDPLAPVTMVIWGDYECPFTGKFMRDTVPVLQEQYGPKRLRIVWKHNPLPFHANARPTHVAAETVFRLGGANAFWNFHAIAFLNQRILDMAPLSSWAAQSGVSPKAFERAYLQQQFASRVDDDLAFGKKVGVIGTPASVINGILLSGAQPVAIFQKTIDEQIQQADELRRAGVRAKHIYARLSDQNHQKPPPPATTPPPDTTTVWNVPLDGSPVRGNKNALVTLVMFGDFQCPFCRKAIPTIAALESKYGDKLRIVFKHNPLPMHPRAEPAAQFAIEAGMQKGDAAFWAAHQAIYDNALKLDESDLLDLANTLRLDPKRIKKAMDGHAHAARIERDQNLAYDLQASGTPHFFINGRRLVGAQPNENFESIIDEEIGKAGQLVADGTPVAKLYETLIKDGKTNGNFQRILAPAPTPDNPAKGAAIGAPITIQMFADFQCPYCRRVQESVDQVLAKYPGKVRVVWRHKPLPMHPFAQMAAEASVEAFRQKGHPGFWAFAARLFEAQSTPTGLDRAEIERIAGETGLNVAKLSAALDARTHWKAVQADSELAERLKINATPSFVINDYFMSGAQPFMGFKRRIEEALRAHKPIPADALIADARQPVPLSTTTPPPLFMPAPSGSSGASASSSGSVANQGGQFGAKHLVVMYAGASRAPAHVTRTKGEARIRAEEARQKLVAGAAFADIVAQYSDEPGAAQRGGDLGTFNRGMMVAEFQAGVENTRVGDISVIVETVFGFHIILRTK